MRSGGPAAGEKGAGGAPPGRCARAGPWRRGAGAAAVGTWPGPAGGGEARRGGWRTSRRGGSPPVRRQKPRLCPSEGACSRALPGFPP